MASIALLKSTLINFCSSKVIKLENSMNNIFSSKESDLIKSG